VRVPTDADVAYVLDLADQILGEDGDRWHTFPWLVSDVDSSAAEMVDCYWRDRQLIADIVDTDVDDRHRRRATIAAAYGLTYVVVDVRRLRSDTAGNLRQVRGDDLPLVAAMLEEPVPEPERWFGMYATNVAWDVDTPYPGDDTDDADDEWAAERAEEWSARRTFDPGWRARGIALAALGAAVLTRRSFGAWEAGIGLDDAHVQLLAALALLGADAHESELATSLALGTADVAEAAQTLAARGLVEEQPDDPPDTGDRLWVVTEAGASAVHEWISRIVPLFAGWPRDNPDIDDATG
jgi:hypothetical protein